MCTFFLTLHHVPRKLDMLNIDLLAKDNATAKSKHKKTQSREDDAETAFHFIAYMPIANNIWKFDGLERQPQRLGIYWQYPRSKAKAD